MSSRYKPQHAKLPTRPRAQVAPPQITEQPQNAPAPATQSSARATQSSAPAAKSVAKSSAVMALGTLVSRILGMVRSPLLLSAVVGLASPVADSFQVANMLPNLIYMVIAGGLLNAVLVPAIVRASQDSADDGDAFINKIITISVVLLGGITILVTLCAPLIVRAFAATMDPEWFHLTVAFAYWCLPQIFFYGIYTVIGQILNARENFGPYMWAPVLNNVIAIAGLLLMLALYGSTDSSVASSASTWLGARVALLGGISTLGIVAQAVVLIWPLRKIGIHYRPDFAWRGAGLSKVGKTSLWALAFTVTGLIPTAVSSNVAAGATMRALEVSPDTTQVAGNAAYQAAFTVYNLPTALVTVSIVTAVFTGISQAAARMDLSSIRRTVVNAINTINALNFLAMAAMIVLSIPISRILMPAVTDNEVTTLARLIIAMAPAIIFLAFVQVYFRVFYAFEKTKYTLLVSIPELVSISVLYLLAGTLPYEWTVVAVAAVKIVGNLLTAVFAHRAVGRLVGSLETRSLLKKHGQYALATVASIIVSGGTVYLIGTDRLAESLMLSLITLFGVGAVLALSYYCVLRMLRVPEAVEIEKFARRFLRKLKR